jgi:hypothetical protein
MGGFRVFCLDSSPLIMDFRNKKLKITGIEALRTLQHAYKINLKHTETKKEWEKGVTLSKAKQDLLFNNVVYKIGVKIR